MPHQASGETGLGHVLPQQGHASTAAAGVGRQAGCAPGQRRVAGAAAVLSLAGGWGCRWPRCCSCCLPCSCARWCCWRSSRRGAVPGTAARRSAVCLSATELMVLACVASLHDVATSALLRCAALHWVLCHTASGAAPSIVPGKLLQSQVCSKPVDMA